MFICKLYPLVLYGFVSQGDVKWSWFTRHQDSWETEAQRRAARLCTFAVEGAQSELDGYTAVQHSRLERTGFTNCRGVCLKIG